MPSIKSRIVSVFAPALLAIALVQPLAAQQPAPESELGNPLLYALAWKQTSAEYRALYHQGFNIARLHVQQARARRQPGDKPLAEITDVDATGLHALSYWGYLVNTGRDFFEDPLWDLWIAENLVTAAPGAIEFLNYCAENGVSVFYVTSRDQGEPTLQIALSNLRSIGAPGIDEQHVTALRESSNKEVPQDEIMKSHQVVVMLGDNLNDFRRKFYIRDDVDGRIAAMEQERDKFGMQYVLFPNPTDGHWLAAIFGESEPPASDTNRQLLKQAASRSAWQGP